MCSLISGVSSASASSEESDERDDERSGIYASSAPSVFTVVSLSRVAGEIVFNNVEASLEEDSSRLMFAISFLSLLVSISVSVSNVEGEYSRCKEYCVVSDARECLLL